MKNKIDILFKDGEEQAITCEYYNIDNGVLYLERIISVDDYEYDEDKVNKVVIIVNMDNIKSMVIEDMDWLGWVSMDICI